MVNGAKRVWGFAVLLLLFSPVLAFAQALPSQSYDLALSKGIHALNGKRYEEAEAAFREALKTRPRDAQATYYLGATQRASGQYKEAWETLKTAAGLDPSLHPVHFDLGVTAFHLERHDEALAELLQAERLEPKSGHRQAMTQYYLGLTYDQLGRFSEAAPKFLRAATLSPELALNARYRAGVSLYRQGFLEEARGEFEEAIRMAPDSKQAASARPFLAEIEKAQPPSPRWSLSLGLGVQYDSNVILLGEDTPLPAGISDESDVRWVGTVQGDLKLFEAARWNGTARYQFYQSLHQDLDDFNVQNHDLGVTVVHRPPGRPYQFRFEPGIADAFVDGEGYVLTRTAAVTAVFSRSRARLTDFRYRYQNRHFRDSDRFPDNDDRTGILQAASLTQYWFFSGRKGNVQAGYTYDRDSARGADWDARGHRFHLGLTLPPLGMQPSLEADVTFRGYDHPNSLSTETPPEEREDTIQVYTLTLQRGFTPRLSGAVQYLYNRNASNIEVYDYNRQIVSVSLTAAF
jgi:tetratricopeptide (TPR) repeat protein